MDVTALAQRLITYDTSTSEGLRNAAGFIKGWLDSRDLEAEQLDLNGLPILVSRVGEGDIKLILHGHIDVVPGRAEQFEPRVDGDRLIGRGAYDMKAAMAAMMDAFSALRSCEGVELTLAIVPDEESEDTTNKASDYLVDEGHVGDFVVTGEPTDMHIGVQAKGVLALRIEVEGKSAHGSTPWLGENAVVRALERYTTIEKLPFTRIRHDLLGSPSVNLGRVIGGDAVNKVPDLCTIDIDVRYVPGQNPQDILDEIGALPDLRVASFFDREPAIVEAENPYVQVLREASQRYCDDDVIAVGRDGTSDAISFLQAGIPAVEFGPRGGGHHGRDEWVSIDSLVRYRQALIHFVELLPTRI